MSITLEDVSILLKIPVTGKVVAIENFSRYTEKSRKDAIELVSKLLGVSPDEAEEEVNITKGLTVRVVWLKSRFCPPKSKSSSTSSSPTTYPPVECTARAYFLYLLSCTLFADKSGSRVSISLLKLLENLDEVGTYAWGLLRSSLSLPSSRVDHRGRSVADCGVPNFARGTYFLCITCESANTNPRLLF
ncbi:hypothetical protein Sjap_015606 [Stephania japonica]|uniref:Aminotransferase-like plant mobile domain-containing protein n=1 Tax=Stephania japonica TaxID=461633 RepID=A0AAP0IJH8_9MAGN